MFVLRGLFLSSSQLGASCDINHLPGALKYFHMEWGFTTLFDIRNIARVLLQVQHQQIRGISTLHKPYMSGERSEENILRSKGVQIITLFIDNKLTLINSLVVPNDKEQKGRKINKNLQSLTALWGVRKSSSLPVEATPPTEPKACWLNSLDLMFHLKILRLK